MTQGSVTLVNKLRRSAKTCLILHWTRWTVRNVVDKITSFCKSVVIVVIFSCVTVSLVVNFSLTEYIESQIPPLFYGVSGEIIQGSDITGNQ